MRADNSIHLSQFINGPLTAVGQYCIISPATFPGLFSPFNVVLGATVLIVNGGTVQTTGVAAWVNVDSNGNIRNVNTPAMPSVATLAANSTTLFVWPQATGVPNAPVRGIGFAITTTMSQSLSYVEITAYIA